MQRLIFAFVIVSYGTADAELLQSDCDLDNNYVAFKLHQSNDPARARTYIVDFQANGPTIRLPPEYYAPDWSDVEEIDFLSAPDYPGYGRLGLRIRGRSGRSYDQPIGIVQRSCWKAATQWLEERAIKVRIKDTSTRTDQ